MLREYLSDRKIPITAFALRIGVARGTLHQYLRGEQFPRPQTLSRIRDETGGAVTANDFMPDVEPIPAPPLSETARAS